MDYSKCIPDHKWFMAEGAKLVLVLSIVTYIFYDSVNYVFVGFLPVGVLFVRDLKRYRQGIKDKLLMEFRDTMMSVAACLEAGYSLERAFILASQEISKQYTGYALIQKELNYIKFGLECNRDITDLLLDFGNRSGIADVRELSVTITAAKRYGGNMIALVRRYTGNIADKQEVLQEIATIVAGKRLESTLMTMAPLGIVLYMKLTNGNYIEVLYSTLYGRVIMTISLMIVVIASVVMDRIVRIEV
ncbi:MAG: type II secretion system F family protein [Wujia sp.]